MTNLIRKDTGLIDLEEIEDISKSERLATVAFPYNGTLREVPITRNSLQRAEQYFGQGTECSWLTRLMKDYKFAGRVTAMEMDLRHTYETTIAQAQQKMRDAQTRAISLEAKLTQSTRKESLSTDEAALLLNQQEAGFMEAKEEWVRQKENLVAETKTLSQDVNNATWYFAVTDQTPLVQTLLQFSHGDNFYASYTSLKDQFGKSLEALATDRSLGAILNAADSFVTHEKPLSAHAKLLYETVIDKNPESTLLLQALLGKAYATSQFGGQADFQEIINRDPRLVEGNYDEKVLEQATALALNISVQQKTEVPATAFARGINNLRWTHRLVDALLTRDDISGPIAQQAFAEHGKDYESLESYVHHIQTELKAHNVNPALPIIGPKMHKAARHIGAALSHDPTLLGHALTAINHYVDLNRPEGKDLQGILYHTVLLVGSELDTHQQTQYVSQLQQALGNETTTALIAQYGLSSQYHSFLEETTQEAQIKAELQAAVQEKEFAEKIFHYQHALSTDRTRTYELIGLDPKVQEDFDTLCFNATFERNFATSMGDVSRAYELGISVYQISGTEENRSALLNVIDTMLVTAEDTQHESLLEQRFQLKPSNGHRDQYLTLLINKRNTAMDNKEYAPALAYANKVADVAPTPANKEFVDSLIDHIGGGSKV